MSIASKSTLRESVINHCKKYFLTAWLILILSGTSLYAQRHEAFMLSTPEAEGVSAARIDSFLTAAAASKHEFHSFIFLRHGKLIAQGWWNPYQSALRHTLYSTSKSFTSTAVGFAVSEKLLSVNDKVISFFPNSLPDTISPNLAQLTVKDLLTMSVGQATDPSFAIGTSTDHWVKTFLALPIKYTPGSHFLYNSLATYMLSAIVQKVTGQKEFDYLKPRLFEPLGITGMDWETSNEGINTGGWGLRIKTEDMAKLGMLYLHKGNWNGKQLLPQAWVDEATTFKIDQAPGAAQSKRDSSDWMQGYCYQFWRCRHNAFRADGAFGQYILVFPDQDAVIAITCETADMQGELNLVWQYLLPAMHQQKLPANKVADKALEQKLTNLALPPLKNEVNAPQIKDQDFNIQPNPLGIKHIAIKAENGKYILTLKKDTGMYTFSFGNGQWLPGETDMQGPSLLEKAKEDFTFLKPYKIDGSCGWQDEHTLQLKLRYIESPHTEIITCHFTGNKLAATFERSFEYGHNKTELTGDTE
jgi:hypothetical protein